MKFNEEKWEEAAAEARKYKWVTVGFCIGQAFFILPFFILLGTIAGWLAALFAVAVFLRITRRHSRKWDKLINEAISFEEKEDE